MQHYQMTWRIQELAKGCFKPSPDILGTTAFQGSHAKPMYTSPDTKMGLQSMIGYLNGFDHQRTFATMVFVMSRNIGKIPENPRRFFILFQPWLSHAGWSQVQEMILDTHEKPSGKQSPKTSWKDPPCLMGKYPLFRLGHGFNSKL